MYHQGAMDHKPQHLLPHAYPAPAGLFERFEIGLDCLPQPGQHLAVIGIFRQIDAIIAPLLAELVLQGQQLPLPQLTLDQRRGEYCPAQPVQHRIAHQLEAGETDMQASHR